MTTAKYLGTRHDAAIDRPEAIPAPCVGMVVTLNCGEFTSHCPVTGQPDFAKLVISYVTDAHIVETKSLKLWLWKWRDARAFNEAIVHNIAAEFAESIQPREVTVSAEFAPRGGISVRPSLTLHKGIHFKEQA